MKEKRTKRDHRTTGPLTARLRCATARQARPRGHENKKARGFRIWLSLGFVLAIAIWLVPMMAAAQATGAASGAAAAPPARPSPWMAVIPVIVPVVIAMLKWVVPSLPSVALPIVAPVLGAVADIALHYAGVTTLGPGMGALLGSAGVGLREIHDQITQTVTTSAPAAAQSK